MILRSSGAARSDCYHGGRTRTPARDEEGRPVRAQPTSSRLRPLRRRWVRTTRANYRAQSLAVPRAGVGAFPRDGTFWRSAGGVSGSLIAQLVRDSVACSVERLDVISLVGQHDGEGLAQPDLNLGQGRAYAAARPQGPCQLRGSPFQPRHDALVEIDGITFGARRSPRLPRFTGRPLRGTGRGRDGQGRRSAPCARRWRTCCRPCGGDGSFGHDLGSSLSRGSEEASRSNTGGDRGSLA